MKLVRGRVPPGGSGISLPSIALLKRRQRSKSLNWTVTAFSLDG